MKLSKKTSQVVSSHPKGIVYQKVVGLYLRIGDKTFSIHFSYPGLVKTWEEWQHEIDFNFYEC